MAQLPALALHRVDTYTFELSGLRTGSVRDQMLRAVMLSRALVEEGLISGTRPLLVLGGGAAGMTLAVAAVREGVDVTVIERERQPFARQRMVKTRWLDPAEYDWPQRHWETERIVESAPGSIPFLYTAAFASTLADDWTQLLRRMPTLPAHGSLRVLHQDAQALHVYSSDIRDGAVVSPWLPNAFVFGAAVSCIGFSGEHVDVPSNRNGKLLGPLFWATDTLDKNYLALPVPSQRPIRVLISGSGDGAMQDFVRLATGFCGKRLAQKLKLNLTGRDLTSILLAEDNSKRSHAWLGKGRVPSHVYEDWHAPYEALVDAIWSEWDADGAHPLDLLRTDTQITWLLGRSTPSFCYGLNRVLALLTLKLIEKRNSDRRILRDDLRLTRVEPLDHHHCSSFCNGEPHRAFVSVRPGPSGS